MFLILHNYFSIAFVFLHTLSLNECSSPCPSREQIAALACVFPSIGLLPLVVKMGC